MPRFLKGTDILGMEAAEEAARKLQEELAVAEAKRLRDEALLPVLDRVQEYVFDIWQEFAKARGLQYGASATRDDSVYGFLLHNAKPEDNSFVDLTHLEMILSDAQVFNLRIDIWWQQSSHQAQIDFREFAHYVAKETGITVRGVKFTDKEHAEKIFEITPRQALEDIFSPEELVTVDGEVFYKAKPYKWVR
jgi:hypothetical protein